MDAALPELDDTRLWPLLAASFALYYRAAPRFSVQTAGAATLILTDEPLSELNIAFIDGGPEAEQALRTFAGLCDERALPGVVWLSRVAAATLSPLRRALNLHQAGYSPLLVCRHPVMTTALQAGGAMRRVETEADLRRAAAITVTTFGLATDSWARIYAPPLLAVPGVDIFLACRDRLPVSAVTTTRVGETVGLWSMATLPGHQGRGVGRALLEGVLRYHSVRGVRQYYLGATPAGRALYESVGFVKASEVVFWSAGVL